MKKNSGFTLIEVLVAMLVLALGLLGLAGLQATGMRNNLSAHHRSQATQLSYDLADRMRANLVDAGLLATSTYATVVPTAASMQNGCRRVANACTPAQMAQNDLFEWNRAIVGGAAVAGPTPLAAAPVTLPMGVGTIAVTSVPNRTFRVSITWDDNRDGAIDASDPNFQMSFQL